MSRYTPFVLTLHPVDLVCVNSPKRLRATAEIGICSERLISASQSDGMAKINVSSLL
jgi:hypothetical protein